MMSCDVVGPCVQTLHDMATRTNKQHDWVGN